MNDEVKIIQFNMQIMKRHGHSDYDIHAELMRAITNGVVCRKDAIEALGYDIITDWPDYNPGPLNDLTTPSLKECECGAKHTSFPDSHLSYCPLHS